MAAQQFVIEGGHPLRGTITASGNKNAALKMLPACLLTDAPVTLHNVPDIGDVRSLIAIMRAIGVQIDWTGDRALRIHAETITTTVIDAALAGKIRASIVLAGPLLARCGQVTLGLPGGDTIGERRIDMHVHAFRALGASVAFDNGLHLHADRLTGGRIVFVEASVTATENAIMAASLARGTTVIENAAGEPHVQDLCKMLVSMGARIDGIGSNRLHIEGVDKLHGGAARVGADFMEVGSYIGAAVMTGGELTIQQADPDYLTTIALVFARLGVSWETRGPDIFVPAHQSLTITPDLGNRIPLIKAQPWPAFPSDLMSVALTVATQSAGTALFHDWMYESRFFFTDRLVRMGARITLCDPHRVLVQGPTALVGQPNITSPDIRAGMAMLLAALAAKGETRIANIQQIDRGYERIDEKLASLGASIRRVESGDES